ncbi:MAG TPA: ATP-binding cassette domain-containing protein [Syntrophomonadaceae bacterium]|nr:ATP-binding cassette domain-containing protein [Syntrophomonadaceae bacterium]
MPIKIENISYTYDLRTPFEKIALTNVSLDIADHTIVGIMGASGSGKSTLLKILAGLLVPKVGKIFIDGENILDKNKSYKHKNHQISLVFQFPEAQFVQDTVYDEIAYGLSFTKLDRTEIETRVINSMELIGLPYKKYRNVKLIYLSSGEKRRVAIATILALQTKYLLLDEPTAGLDYLGRKDLKESLIQLKTSKTIIIVSHNLKYLLSICDEIYIMSTGTIESYLSKNRSIKDFANLYQQKYQLPAYIETLVRLNQMGWSINTNNTGVTEAAQAIAQVLNTRSY